MSLTSLTDVGHDPTVATDSFRVDQTASLKSMRYIALAVLGSLVLLAGLVAAGLVWWEWPNVSIREQGHSVVVHTELMHDYPSDVGQFRITEAESGRVIWDGRPEDRMVQIHSLTFNVGENDSRPAVFGGRFRDVGAGEAKTFRLEEGVRYLVKVCTPTVFPLCETQSFAFQR